jgi:hypothetical protein
MQNYNKIPRSGRNCGTIRHRPKRLLASDPPMSERQRQEYGLYVQTPIQDLIDESFMDWDDLRAIDLARESRKNLERCWKLEEENAALKAETQRLRAELEILKMKTSNPSPVIVQETKYRDAVTITPETIEKRKMENFFRRVRLYFILLDTFNQIIKLRCKFDDDEAEIEGCGSVLRKIFELVTSTTANISGNTLTIPDLDFKFYGSKSEFEEFAKEVSKWICEKKLNIPDTHFIICKMNRFTARKQMSNGQIAEYEKFTLEVIDSSTKEIFMIDIMNVDGSTVFPCDFTVNSLAVSPTHGIYSKDPLHRKGKFNFLYAIFDIISKTTTCMTRSPWNFDEFSLNFLTRRIKMHEAGYEILGSPKLTLATCPITCDNALCINITGCRCKNSKGDQIPLLISIYAAIRIFSEKRCPNCRDILKEFVCSTVKPRQFMQKPNELPSKLEFECLVKRAEAMSQGYSISGFDKYSEESKDALSALSEFFRKSEEQESDFPMRASGPQMRAAAPVPAALQNRAGDGAAVAPVRQPQYDSDSDGEEYYARNIWRGS